MVMLKAATPAALGDYYDGIKLLVDDYPGSWSEISTADELCRREQWPMMLETGLTEIVGTDAEGNELTRRVQNEHTWSSIIQDSAYQEANRGELGAWWRTHLTKPLDRAGRGGPVTAAPVTNQADGTLIFRSGARPPFERQSREE